MAEDASLCGGCGYSLRGLPDGCTCPECGPPTAAGYARRMLLRYRPRRWLVRLRDGFGLQAAVFSAAALYDLLVVYVVYVAGLRTAGWVAFQAVLPVSLTVLDWCGVWNVTTPEPGVDQAAFSTRRSLRVTVAATALFMVLGLRVLPARSAVDGDLTLLATGALRAAELVLWCLWVRNLARRLPDRGLELHGWVLSWGLGLCVASATVLATATHLLIHVGVRVPLPLSRWDALPLVDGLQRASDLLLLDAAYVCFRFYRTLRAFTEDTLGSPT